MKIDSDDEYNKKSSSSAAMYEDAESAETAPQAYQRLTIKEREISIKESKKILEYKGLVVYAAVIVLMVLCLILVAFNIAVIAVFAFVKAEHAEWHIFGIITVSFVSGIVALFAILLRGVFPKKSNIDDTPAPALIKAIWEGGLKEYMDEFMKNFPKKP